MAKFNWGHGIIVFFICFISFMGYLAFRSSQENIDLVTEDYYKQELAYQSQMDKIRNTQLLPQSLRVRVQKEGVLLQFPQLAAPVVGQLQLFRPSDAQFDRFITLAPDVAGQQLLDVKGLPAGLYRLKVEWQAGDQAYYTEEAIHLQ